MIKFATGIILLGALASMIKYDYKTHIEITIYLLMFAWLYWARTEINTDLTPIFTKKQTPIFNKIIKEGKVKGQWDKQ